MSTVSLKCHCGEVKGSATDVSPKSGIRVICCCSDCQAFANHLSCESQVLDEFGGTEIFQVSQSQVTIKRGHDKLRCLRLTDKGLLRWYTSCCNTPVGNTINAKLPFVGIIHSFINEKKMDQVLGDVRSAVQTQHARGEPTYPKQHKKFPLGLTAQIARKMALWKLHGMQKPSVFFGDDDRPVVKPIIVDELPT